MPVWARAWPLDFFAPLVPCDYATPSTMRHLHCLLRLTKTYFGQKYDKMLELLSRCSVHGTQMWAGPTPHSFYRKYQIPPTSIQKQTPFIGPLKLLITLFYRTHEQTSDIHHTFPFIPHHEAKEPGQGGCSSWPCHSGVIPSS